MTNAFATDTTNAITSLADYHGQFTYLDGYGQSLPTYPRVYPWIFTTTVVANGHRVCTCPNCAGDCCGCADCTVKRLEKRVAALEAGA